jgi:4-amino-4-deoxy-L-arabinose transferase-like glycosyltransferase
MELFGTSPTSVRGLSVVAGVATVFATYVAGRELHSHPAGLFAAMVTAVSPLHVHFSQTARMYSLAAALTTAAFAAFAGLYNRRYRQHASFWYVITATGMIYTHGVTLAVMAVQAVYALLVGFRGTARGLSVPETARLKSVVTILSIPWLGAVAWILMQLLIGGDNGGRTVSAIGWIETPGPAIVWRTVLSFGGAVVNYPVDTALSTARPIAIGVTALLLALVAYAVWLARRQLFTVDHHPALLAAAWAVGPILLAVAVSHLFFPVFSPRYMIVASTGLYVAAGIGLAELPRPSLRVAVAALVIVGLLGSLAIYYETDTSEQWGPALEPIAAGDADNTVVLGVPSATHMVFEYYLPPRYRALGVREDGTGVTEAVAGNETVWVVSRYPGQSDRVRERLDGPYRQTRHHSAGSVQVYRFRRSNRTAAGGTNAERRSPSSVVGRRSANVR